MHVSLHDRVILPDNREGEVMSLHRAGKIRVSVRGQLTDWIDGDAVRSVAEAGPHEIATPDVEEPAAEEPAAEDPASEDGDARPT